ncbi:MAG: hypothetical protein HZC40_14180 [Chloroflexi bacterium]|jgi:hypothetical protein|nr:hypothetical protein [Chloroflexota bacterium]
MSQTNERCAHCGRTSAEIPLLSLQYQGKQYWICPQGMPVLIHKPHQLAELAGAWTKDDAPQPAHNH